MPEQHSATRQEFELSRGQDMITTRCGKLIPRDPAFIDLAWPSCRECCRLINVEIAAEDAKKQEDLRFLSEARNT